MKHKNEFKKGDIIFLVDAIGNDDGQMWVDRDLEVAKGDIFEIGTTKNFPLIKMECMSSQTFPLVARIIEN